MDRNLIIAGIVAAVLLLGGLGYAVMRKAEAPPPPSPAVPATQLQNELPPDAVQSPATTTPGMAPAGMNAPAGTYP